MATRRPVSASVKAMSVSGATVAVVVAATLLGLAFPAAVAAQVLDYTTNTPAPEGRAVCSIKGTIKEAVGAELVVTLSPSQGEARLDLELRYLDALGPTVVDALLGAGTQPGCDIFPNTPSGVALPFKLPTEVVGILDLHAHPGSDCASGFTARGTVTIAPTLKAKFARPKCDGDPTHANLHLRTAAAPLVQKGETLSELLRIENHGPGDATDPIVSARIPKAYDLKNFSTSKGTCHFAFKKNTLLCDLGFLPISGTADVTLDLIPLEEGTFANTFKIIAKDGGKLFPHKEKVKTDVAKGTSSILSLTLKCKGAAGTVTINPNGNGGVTTCTCPDPNDATRDVVQCIEIYSQQTAVTLTPAATTGQFNKWTGACAGNPAACIVTLDPAAQNPDQSATAKFK